MSQLHTTSRKVMIKYVGPIVIYKIIDSGQLSINDIRWKNTKRTFQTWKIKPSKYKNKSRKCSKSCTIKTSYECLTQNLRDINKTGFNNL